MPMKRHIRHWTILPAMAALAVCAQGPDWWQERGVLVSGRTPGAFNPVNQGHVKWMAAQAAREFVEKLPGAGSDALLATVAAFPAGHDFRPANLGMLKAAAKPFYDRLIAEGLAQAYPWTGGTPADFNLANQGQLKNLFSFDLDTLDIDQDGVPDWQTKLFGTRTELTVVGATGTVQRTGSWLEVDGMLHASGVNGDLSYLLTLPTGGVYGVEIEGVESLPSAGTQRFELEALVGGFSLGRESFNASRAEPGRALFLLPLLPAGSVTLTVRWHNLDPHKHLAVTAVRLLAFGAGDWYARRFAADTGHVQAPATSYVSPVCVEGHVRKLDALSVAWGPAAQPEQDDDPVTPLRGIQSGWYANVPLSDAGATRVTVHDADGATNWTGQIDWLACNLITGTTTLFTVRSGDSMRFGALPDGQSNGVGTIEVTGMDALTVTSSAAATVLFEAPGDYQVAGVWSNGASTAQGETLVRVVAASFGTNPVVWAGHSRTWPCPALPSEAVVDFDRLGFLRLAEVLPTPSTGRAFQLDSTGSGESILLARLGAGGPVLAQTTVDAFKLLSSTSTGYQPVEYLGDGSVIKVMPIVAGDIPEGAQIRLNIFIAGVTFEDGSVEKWIGREDLDANGVYFARFVHTPGHTLSSCHTLEVWLDGDRIGLR